MGAVSEPSYWRNHEVRIERLELAGHAPLAKGKKRYVFRHPSQPGLVVKVFIRPSAPRSSGTLKAYFQERRRRDSSLSGFTRELREYAASRFDGEDALVGYVPDLFGFVDTDIGLGLVVAAVTDRNGDLGSTLVELVRSNRVTRERVALLEELFQRVIRSNLVIGDFTARNIVLSEKPGGVERFVLVDGLGDKTFVCMQRWFPLFNHWSKWRRVVRLRKRIASGYYCGGTAKLACTEMNRAVG